MPTDDAPSLNDEQTFEGGALPSDSAERSLGDQSTFGGGDESSLSDIGGLTGDAGLDMEIVDLSRYEVQETLGKGGMGEVLLATDTRLNRKVAIKRMLGDGAKSQTAVRRFLTEAQSIAALNHFNIVQIYDYGRDKDGPFLIMEYVDGGSLLDRCRAGALPQEEAVELTCQLCDGLEMAHDAGIIHRDIKPANVLLTSRGEPKLTDFGLARQDTGDTGQTMAGAVLGTLDFMPPEQRRDATQTDARSDLWSLAATLYQLVTGEPPRVIDLDEVPQELRSCLAQALKQKQDDRYQTAGGFKEALQETTRTASQPIQEPAAELGAGECPKCHTKNEASRKFCQGCGGSLRLSCLSCDEQIPVWDNFCAECGGNQVELIASKLEAFAKQRDQAEEHRREYRFEDAISIARSLTSVEDERLAEHVPWAVEFVTATEAEWESERESAAAHFEEARTHRDAFDYASAIHAVESVPEAMRTSEVSGYLQQLERDRAESEELIKTISGRVKRRDLKGLLEQVERAVELRGERTDLQKLAGQLREREEKRREQRDAASNENTLGMQFKPLPGGTFTMGEGEEAHQVTLTQPFHLGVYEVTQEQYEAVMGTNPSQFKAPQNPVENVSWDDAVEFCRKLSALQAEKSTGFVYRLPTEAEWEYACRAGTTTKYSFSAGESYLRDYAWYFNNSAYPKSGGFWNGLFKDSRNHHPVGQKKPNPWGLYDMHGNVFEWCQDWYGNYPSGSVTDPTGAASSSSRVIRGGGWLSYSVFCRSADRSWSTPGNRSDYLGFRVVRSSIK